MANPKISDLVKGLKEAYDKHGDVEVIMSHDEEGNSFSMFRQCEVDKINGNVKVVLWPDHEEFDLTGS